MTIEEFQSNFYLRFEKSQIGNELHLITEVIEKSNDQIVDGIRTVKDTSKLSSWLQMSQSNISITPWTIDKLLNFVMRAHFDHFCRLIPIEDFFPLDTKTNPDIMKYYLNDNH